jgi:hypothetical protein
MAIFHFKDTPENHAHADAINGIMKRKDDLAKAETTHIKSKAALPWLLGCSAFVLCAGVGGGVGLWGYSYIVGNKVIARQVAESVKAVLDTTTIHGTVTGEVGMRDGIVRLDQSSALVRVVAPADMLRPSPEQVRQDERPASQATLDDTEPTWQSVYKVVWFGSGRVQSFASFRTSTAQKPFRRKCIYFEDVGEGLWRGVLLESNGQRLAPPNPSPFPAVDLNAAAAECVTLTNLPVQAVAPVAPAQTILVHAAKR